MRIRLLVTAACVFCAGTEQMAAQSRNMRDSSVGQIVRMVRSLGKGAGTNGSATDVLRQNGMAQPRSKLDELADSLTVLAMEESRRGDPVPNVIINLVSAGDLRRPGGTPYDGTLERLIRIHREGEGSARLTALIHMLQVPGRSQAIAYLRSVVTSTDRSAWTALGAFIAEARPEPDGTAMTSAHRNEALTILRELALSNRVVEPETKSTLQLYAAQRGWLPPTL